MFSNRVNNLSKSMTISISTLAKKLKQEGKDILSFSAGEPDFDTPKKIKEKAILCMERGETKYTAVGGTDELLESISNKLKKENNLFYHKDEIVTTNGVKHGLFNIIQALIDMGDEVIIPAPYWVTYPELVEYSGGKSIIIKTKEKNNFKISPEELENAITDKTKLLILTTPSNPTGILYKKSELEALAKILKNTNIKVISDEIYEKLIFKGNKFISTASISKDMFNRTITLNGLSKSVAMTGWRFGYLASNDNQLISNILKLQSQSTSNINSITQGAAISALNGDVNEEIEEMRLVFEKRAEISFKLLSDIDGLKVIKPDGAFYLFVQISKYSNNSIEFCEKLLSEANIAVVPGIAFGFEGYFRFSFATDLETINKGIKRINDFIIRKYKK